MRYISSLLLVFLLLASRQLASAQRFAYLYIQGDKKTPFYVKLEGEMAPRFGKNYCILPQLAAGTTHVQILFQQNAFPAQDYTIKVPEGGSRSFMLAQKDGGYQLYDMEQNFYLPPGNSAEDDHLPITATLASSNELIRGETSGTTAIANDPTPDRKPTANKPQDNTIRERPDRKPVVPKPVPHKTGAAATASPATGEPAFIGGIELDRNEDRTGTESSVPAGSGNAAETNPAFSRHIPNSDCPAPVSTETFSAIFARLGGKDGDEDKLRYLDGQMSQCFESWQARSLTGALETDAARFTLLKKIYPRITDQEAFPLLDDLLRTDTWKTEFHRLVHTE